MEESVNFRLRSKLNCIVKFRLCKSKCSSWCYGLHTDIRTFHVCSRVHTPTYDHSTCAPEYTHRHTNIPRVLQSAHTWHMNIPRVFCKRSYSTEYVCGQSPWNVWIFFASCGSLWTVAETCRSTSVSHMLAQLADNKPVYFVTYLFLLARSC